MKKIAAIFTLLSLLCLSACDKPISSEAIERKYTSEDSRFIEIHGNRIHYLDQGPHEAGLGKDELGKDGSSKDRPSHDAQQGVILLIHGTASSLHTWDNWADLLQSDYRVLRLDLPGFGLTGPDVSARYQVADDVALLQHFLAALDIPKVHLVGSSLGGRIAWQYALEHQNEVASLTLMNALGYPQASWPPLIELAQWPVFDEIIKRFLPRFMYGIGLKDVYHDAALVNEVLIDRYYELSLYQNNMSAFPDRVKTRLDKDADQIKNLTVPTLIQWGKEDRYFPVANAFRFAEDIAGSSLKVYEQVGHLPMEEVPEQSVADYLDFLDQTSRLNSGVWE